MHRLPATPFVALLAFCTLVEASPAPEVPRGSVTATSGPPSTPATLERAELLVIAPHPDDETLMTAGVLQRAVQSGRRVAVALITNGDFGCGLDGYQRQQESIAALAKLGVAEDKVHFLGYPDGHLAELGVTALAPLPRRDAEGRCGTGNTTYAVHGAGKRDLHSVLTQSPAPYLASSLVSDLADLLEHVQPHDIFVSHPQDEHLDHAFTYVYLRRALERVEGWRPSPALRIHRALVHLGGCWPTAPGEAPCPPVYYAPNEPTPALPPPFDGYLPNERLLVPAAMRRLPADKNPKIVAISSYPSQTGARLPLSYLFSFAHRDEVFFTEQLRSDGHGQLWRRRAAGVGPGEVRPSSAFTNQGGRFVRSVQQRAPLACSVTASPTKNLDFAFLADAHSAYHLRVLAGSVALTDHEDHVLRQWPLPADAEPESHRYTVALDPRPDDGGVAELSVRRDGELLGVAIDPSPRMRGARILVDDDPRRADPDCRPIDP